MKKYFLADAVLATVLLAAGSHRDRTDTERLRRNRVVRPRSSPSPAG